MGDAENMSLSSAICIHPFKRHPIAREGDISAQLHLRWLKFNRLKHETFTGLRGNPIGNVIFPDRRGANRWPTQEVLVPQV